MTDSGKQRPRRAFSADDAQPDGVDDTRSGHAGRARRGAADDIDSPFARPASSFEESAVPAPVLPGTERPAMPGSGAGRRAMRWDGLDDKTTPAGQESVSETTVHATTPPTRYAPSQPDPQHRTQQPTSSWGSWPDHPSTPTRAAGQPRTTTHRSPARAANPEPETDKPWQANSQKKRREDSAASHGWIAHHRRMLTTWVVTVVAAAVLLAGGIFVLSRLNAPNPAASNANPSSSETNSTPVQLTEASLLDTSDAGLIEPTASWSITQTVTEKGKETLRKVSCLESDPAEINTTATLQRAIGTQHEDKLALIHQIDAYANEETAKKIYEQRVTSLTSCSATPALITGSSTVAGLGDEMLQLSVLQESNAQHHTILLVRTGKVISLLDVARNNSAVDPKGAVSALQRPLTATCEAAAGSCPTTPTVTPTAPPAANPPGWLIPNDIPIIAPGHQAWIGGSPREVELSGMGCEGVNLTSEQGPTDRKQRSYTVSSSDEAFKIFGITQYRFTFADEAAATAFSNLLSENLASCAKRVAAAKVTELSPVTTDGSNGPVVTARLFDVKQQIADDGTQRPYQLIVTRSGTAVSYLLFTGVGETQFTAEQLTNLATRLGQRTAQG